MKLLPIGTEDFSEIIKKDLYYVDKKKYYNMRNIKLWVFLEQAATIQ